MSEKKIGVAFAKGVQVASGVISESAAREWIGSCARFAAAHPGAADTCDPDELGEALEAAFSAGLASKIPIPRPTAPDEGDS